tara:strand:+ start:100 stop:978 length:879 start_codon:yes stop_codon:yes gene_type:complete
MSINNKLKENLESKILKFQSLLTDKERFDFMEDIPNWQIDEFVKRVRPINPQFFIKIKSLEFDLQLSEIKRSFNVLGIAIIGITILIYVVYLLLIEFEIQLGKSHVIAVFSVYATMILSLLYHLYNYLIILIKRKRINVIPSEIEDFSVPKTEEKIIPEKRIDVIAVKQNIEKPISNEKEVKSKFSNLSQNAAIKELKKQKELLELEVISKGDYEKIKNDLSQIILNKESQDDDIILKLIDFIKSNYMIIIIILVIILFVFSFLDFDFNNNFDEEFDFDDELNDDEFDWDAD